MQQNQAHWRPRVPSRQTPAWVCILNESRAHFSAFRTARGVTMSAKCVHGVVLFKRLEPLGASLLDYTCDKSPRCYFHIILNRRRPAFSFFKKSTQPIQTGPFMFLSGPPGASLCSEVYSNIPGRLMFRISWTDRGACSKSRRIAPQSSVPPHASLGVHSKPI